MNVAKNVRCNFLVEAPGSHNTQNKSETIKLKILLFIRDWNETDFVLSGRWTTIGEVSGIISKKSGQAPKWKVRFICYLCKVRIPVYDRCRNLKTSSLLIRCSRMQGAWCKIRASWLTAHSSRHSSRNRGWLLPRKQNGIGSLRPLIDSFLRRKGRKKTSAGIEQSA